MDKVKLSQKLTESGLMMALATILSVFKIAELPYGGSITFAALLPIVIVAYRYGFRWGLLCASTYGLIQMLLGLKNVSYATSAAAAVAIILLDYILAFGSASLGGLFRRMKEPATALGLSALAACALRFVFHVVSGCTVWAGLSIPTTDALVYSVVYNITYMLPETIVTVLAAVYLASVLEFRYPRLSPVRKNSSAVQIALAAAAGLVAIAALAAIVALVFVQLQNPESGEFDITGISNVDFTAVGIIAAAAAVGVIVLCIVRSALGRRSAAN